MEKQALLLLAIFGYATALNHRVVGGKEVNIESYPHQLSLQYIDSHICGASLIGPSFVITAAHCTNEKVSKFLYIRAGTSLKDEGGVDVNITKVIQHPQFDPKTFDYDITVIQLQKPLAYGKTIQPIGLPAKYSPVAPGTVCTVTGWGYENEGGHFADHLREVDLPIIEHKTCEDYYKVLGEQITERMICAGYPQGGKDACQGDSGGPLITNGKLVGVVSWGEGCAKPKQPGIFANVVFFRDFILQNTGI